MGFFKSFGMNLGAMFGLSGLYQTEAQKLQAQLGKAQQKLTETYRTGMIGLAKDQIEVEEQLLSLINTNSKLADMQSKYVKTYEDEYNKVQDIQIITLTALIFTIIFYILVKK